MEFRKVYVSRSVGENVTTNPAELTEYRDALQKALPDVEPYIPGEAAINLATLHSSMAFRAAIVRLENPVMSGHFDIHWRDPEQHEISDDGSVWSKASGRALRFSAVLSGYADPVFLGIHFSATP